MINFKKKEFYILSPLTYFIASYLYQIIVTPYVFIQLVPEKVDLDAYIQTFWISLLFLGSVIIGWQLGLKFGTKTINKFLNTLCLGLYKDNIKYKNNTLIIIFLFLFIISFIILALRGGGGIIWLTDSRVAYQAYRIGAGEYYAAAVTFLQLSYMVSVFADSSKKYVLLKLTIKTLIFVIISFFLGAKSVMIGFFVTAVLYYNYYIAKLKSVQILSFFLAFWMFLSGLQLIQGSALSFEDTILYADYFQNTSEFLRRFDEFTYQWGYANLSSFWVFIPRGLYPDKPYNYGNLMINEVLFPGAAEQAFSPAVMPWAVSYLDFGIVGVFLSGLIKGLTFKWTLNYFIKVNKGLLGFIIFLKLGELVEVFIYTQPLLFLLILLPLFSMFMHLFKELSK